MFNIDFNQGNILIIEKDIVDNISLKELLPLLREDLLWVEYEKLSLDVGWYCLNNESFYSENFNNPSDNILEKGLFRVCIIENDDWENSIYNKTCINLADLKVLICESLEIINKYRIC